MSSLYSRSRDVFLSRLARSDSQISSCSLTTRSFRERSSRVAPGPISKDSATDRSLVRSTSHTSPRETQVVNLNTVQDKSDIQNYKKMYEGALAENERLRSRLEVSKQELSKIRAQMEKITQDRKSESTSMIEAEKKEKQVLEKKILEMEEKFKVMTDLKSQNQKLKDENSALIRSISKRPI